MRKGIVVTGIFAMLGVLGGTVNSEADFLRKFLTSANGYKTGRLIYESGVPMVRI